MALSRRKLLTSAAAVGALSASGAVFAPAIAQARPVRIGILAPRSGIAAAPGENGIRATQWAAERFNAQGGIAGRKIELVIEEESSPKDTIERFSKLVQQEKVDCVQGIISTGAGLALGPVVEEARALTIYWDGTTQDGVDEKIPNPRYLFRSTDNECEAIMASLLAIKHWKGQFVTVAGINPDYSYGRNNMAAFIALLKRFNIDHKVVTEQWPKVGTMDLTSHVAALKAAKPDLIFSSLLFADLPVFMKQAHAAELTKGTKLVFPAAGWQHTLMKKEFTPEGMLFGHNTLYFANPNASPLAKEFVAWYERTHKDYPELGGRSRLFRHRVLQGGGGEGGDREGRQLAVAGRRHRRDGRAVGRKPRRQGLLAQGPHRRPDLRPGLHHPQQQVRLRDARHVSRRCSRPTCRSRRARISGSGSRPRSSRSDRIGRCPHSPISCSAACFTPPSCFWSPPGCSSCSACRRSSISPAARSMRSAPISALRFVGYARGRRPVALADAAGIASSPGCCSASSARRSSACCAASTIGTKAFSSFSPSPCC